MLQQRPQVKVSGPRCPYCHADVVASQKKVACDGCMAWHHADCWSEHTACSACGFECTSGGGAVSYVSVESCHLPACHKPQTVQHMGHRYCRVHAESFLRQGKWVCWLFGAPLFGLLCVMMAARGLEESDPGFAIVVVLCLAAVVAFVALGRHFSGRLRREFAAK